ncbi:MAG: SDR family oxidoreductase [Deferrisomatales bacterium]|nr:SDR family oxidoreductase [Deferrisomatales bacterium]
MPQTLAGSWALILGASSGFGAATARALAARGMNIFGVHLDRKPNMPMVNDLVEELRATGVRVCYFNSNAADAENRRLVLDDMGEEMGDGPKLRVFLHSLAFGTLKPYIGETGQVLTQAQMQMTLDVMAHSLVYWVQDLVQRRFFEANSRVFAMTSSGGHVVWPYYGAVSAAKAALESHIRQLALELAPKQITANGILAGVTDTPALRQIPGHDHMLEVARGRNPMGRLTQPGDVAGAIACFSQPECYWLNGSILRVDGGEDVVG